MFTKKFIIKDVGYFSKYDEGIIILKNDGINIIEYDNQFELVSEIISEIKIGIVFKNNQNIFALDSFSNRLMSFSNGDFHEISPTFRAYRESKYHSKYICGFDFNSKYIKNRFKVLDLSKLELQFEVKDVRARSHIIDSDCFYIDNRATQKKTWHEIIKLSKSGRIVWRYDISEVSLGGNILWLIGIYNNILIVGIGSDWLIGIDTQTGRLLWKHKAIPDFDILDKEKGVLHSITSGYVKRDATTGEIIDLFDNRDYFEEEAGIASQRDNYVISGKHLITTDWRKGRIGAFNTETHQFDWIYDEPGVGFPGGFMMEYYDPYLFIMDSTRNLHVFEKE